MCIHSLFIRFINSISNYVMFHSPLVNIIRANECSYAVCENIFIVSVLLVSLVFIFFFGVAKKNTRDNKKHG